MLCTGDILDEVTKVFLYEVTQFFCVKLLLSLYIVSCSVETYFADMYLYMLGLGQDFVVCWLLNIYATDRMYLRERSA